MDFSKQILLLILNQCELPELKNLLSVSKRFRELIVSTPELMRKIPVIFFMESWRETIPFVEKNGKFVRSVKFDYCKQFNSNDTKAILSLTPNVECFEFASNHMENYEAEEADNVELNLKSLKSISIDTNDVASVILINDLRNCRSIEKFAIDAYFYKPTTIYGNFLTLQKNLTELDVSSYDKTLLGINAIFTKELRERKDLRLKTLKLNCDVPYDEGFSAFLRSQSKNVEHFVIRSYRTDFHYYRLVFSGFTNLRKLSFGTDEIINDARAAEIEKYSLPSVIEFNADTNVEDISVFAAVMKMFPNLEVLSIAELNFELTGILETLPKLRKLQIDDFKIEMMIFARSLSLRELDVTIQDPMMLSVLWKSLAGNCPNIERLVIKDIGNRRLSGTISREIEKILRNLKNFTQLVHCEIINTEVYSPGYNDDYDNREHQGREVAEFDRNVKFLLKQNFDETFTLSISNYFNEYQREGMIKVREDFEIREENAIN